MARPGITYQEVAAAAGGLLAEDKKPTIQGVRAALGNTGSPNTIHRHLTTWRETAPALEPKAPDLPPELRSAIVRELERQAADARSEPEARLVEVRAEAAELVAVGEKLEEEMAALTDRNRDLSGENQRLAALAEERAGEIRKLAAELAREREAAEKARLELAQARNRIETREERIGGLVEETREAEAKLGRATAARVESEKAVAVAEARLNETRGRVAGLDDRLAEASAALTEKARALTDCEKTNARLQADLDHFKRELKARERETDRLRAIGSPGKA